MAEYEKYIHMKTKEEYSLEEKGEFFDKIWELTKNYFDHYEEWGGDNEDEEFEFKEELKNFAVDIVFPDKVEDDVIEFIDDLEKESDDKDEDDE